MELLQIATAQFITKCDRLLLQIATAFLLQSATRFITNCDRYYKVRWIYYKSRQLLQSAMIITNCDSTNVCRNSTFQGNRKKNATGRRRLTSSNRPAFFVSAVHSKNDTTNLFDYKLGESKENNKTLLFFSGKETIQNFEWVHLSHNAVVCKVINL